jgi:hypothetical protein
MDWSPILVTITSVVLGLDTLCCVWITWCGRRFLRRVDVIETETQLEDFRRTVARCQWGAFGFAFCFLLASLGSGAACVCGLMRRADLEPVAVMGCLRIAVAAYVTLGVEQALKAMRGSTVEHQRSINHILMDWEQAPFPKRLRATHRPDSD